MKSPTKITLVIVSSLAIAVVLLFGGVMLGSPLRGGMMGNGAMGGSGWMLLPALLWVWIPTLFMVALGILLVGATINHKKRMI